MKYLCTNLVKIVGLGTQQNSVLDGTSKTLMDSTMKLGIGLQAITTAL